MPFSSLQNTRWQLQSANATWRRYTENGVQYRQKVLNATLTMECDALSWSQSGQSFTRVSATATDWPYEIASSYNGRIHTGVLYGTWDIDSLSGNINDRKAYLVMTLSQESGDPETVTTT